MLITLNIIYPIVRYCIVDIEKVKVSTTFPTGFKYTRFALSADRQSNWKDAMYYLPFNTEDTYKMKKFVSNEVW